MSFDDRIREALERTAAGLKTQLERDLAAFSDDLRSAAAVQVGEVRGSLQAQLDEARRLAQTAKDEAEQAAHVEIDAVRRAANAEVEELRHRVDQQLEEARRTLEQRTADVQRRAGVDVESARAEAAAARAELESLRADAAQARAELAHARGEEERARLLTELARTEAADNGAELDRARAAVNSARAQAESLGAEAEAARHEAEVAHAERASASAEAARLRGELEHARSELTSARSELDHARAQLAAAVAASERPPNAAAHAAVPGELADAAGQAEKRIQETVCLVEAVRALDGTHGLGETLDVLADRAARHAERTAVLVVKGDRLLGRRLIGFPGQNPVPRVNVDLDAAGIAGAVVKQAAIVTRSPVESLDEGTLPATGLPDFAENAGARHAVALPLLVGGQVVAVLYADASPAETPEANEGLAALEVLARHASRTLEVMTVRQATGLSRPANHAAGHVGSERRVSGAAGQDAAGDDDAARRYARLLVSEIRMYHEPVVNEGRRSRDLRARLGGEIDRARRLYEERVPPALRERSDYFEQELVRTLADGDRSLLG